MAAARVSLIEPSSQVWAYADSSAHLAHMQADGHGELMGAVMGLIDSLEFSVLGELTPEHAEALANVPGAHFYSGFASK